MVARGREHVPLDHPHDVRYAPPHRPPPTRFVFTFTRQQEVGEGVVPCSCPTRFSTTLGSKQPQPTSALTGSSTSSFTPISRSLTVRTYRADQGDECPNLHLSCPSSSTRVRRAEKNTERSKTAPIRVAAASCCDGTYRCR